MNLVIAICGMSGAGKSTVRECFQKYNFEYIHFGSTEETMRRYGETSEEKERIVRIEMRKEFGMGAMAIIHLNKIKSLLEKNKDVVIDNMYSWDEYKILKEEFEDGLITIAVLASPEIRYKRLSTREIRPRDKETSQKRDYSELEELDKGAPIAMADFNIINESGEEDLFKKVERIIKELDKIQNIKKNI